MSADRQTEAGGPFPSRPARLMIVLAGIVLGQAILYGPSLAGRKVLLPLDILTEPRIYLPQTAATARVEVQDPLKLDLVEYFEPARRFAASELRAGRLPMWAPYHYAGAPFIWPKFSPFLALECCTQSPVMLPWGQMLAALVAGLGMYAFSRRVLGTSFWPAAIGAWCYPLTGFFVFWQGYPTCGAIYWLPWLMLAVDKTARMTHRLAPAGLSVATCLTLISGHLDVAGQALLISGLYGLWCVADAWPDVTLRSQAKRAALRLAAGWTIGFLLAAPYVLPAVDYAQTGSRMARRAASLEERPPVGFSALPQTVLPDMCGSVRTGSLRLVEGYEVESSAAAYTGVVATLLLAPLAWCSLRHRRRNVFWIALSVFGLSWCLALPGFVQLLRLPGLNMMSHNRLVFATSFSFLALAATGLEVFSHGPVRWQRWFLAPATLLAGLGAWCIYRSVCLPGAVGTELELAIRQGKSVYWWIHNMHDVERVQAWFVHHYAAAAALCGIGVAGWVIVWLGKVWQARLLPVVAAVLVGDLLWFACGRNPQCEPALYFPPIPVLEQVAHLEPGRIIGVNCLPASLAGICGLRDVRGYDSVDPAAFVSLIALGADSRSHNLVYAQTQWLLPDARKTPDGGIRLSPIMDLLGVRYVIFRGSPLPDARPVFQGPDYWVLTNALALPRAFVPRRVEVVADEETRLRKLGSAQFDPREVAYVESPLALPAACQGQAELLAEVPTHLTLSVQMQTPGLVVLADLWDEGWHARLSGKPVPILRANHALRGVVVPAGTWKLEFRYWPASFTWGLGLAGLAATGLVVWTLIVAWVGRKSLP